MCSNCRDYEGPYDDNEERTEPPIVRGAASKGVASAPYDHSAEINARYRQLAKLREEIEQYRAAYERAKKASQRDS